MIRRRRPTREIAFSFDSFLDLVANVVGIIIRLILVAWVGARSYSALQIKPTLAAPVAESRADPADPVQDELTEHRRELARVQALLLDKLREMSAGQEERKTAVGTLATLASRCRGLDEQHAALERENGDTLLAPTGASAVMGSKVSPFSPLSLTELRERCRKVTEEIHTLEKLPPAKQTLRYRTPVSEEVHSEELMFECHGGRASFIQTAALLAEVRQKMSEKKEALRSQWQIDDVVGPISGFQLRFTVERDHEMLDGIVPDPNANFRYGVSEWHLEPVDPGRGETTEAALAKGSQFRQIVDPLDPQITAVTFWVYPDSFTIYRQLRDYLFEHNIMVAGRPLPEGKPITSSRRGSASRGQ